MKKKETPFDCLDAPAESWEGITKTLEAWKAAGTVPLMLIGVKRETKRGEPAARIVWRSGMDDEGTHDVVAEIHDTLHGGPPDQEPPDQERPS